MDNPIDYLLGNKITFRINSYSINKKWYAIISNKDNIDIFIKENNDELSRIYRITKEELEEYIEKEIYIKLKFNINIKYIKNSNNILININKFIDYYKNKNIEVKIKYIYKYD